VLVDKTEDGVMSRAHDPVSSSSVIQRKSWPGHSDDTFGTHNCWTHRAHNCTLGWATSRTPALSPESSQNEQARWDAINEAYLDAGFRLLARFTGQAIFDGNLVQWTDGRQFGSRPVNPISRSNRGASSATGTGGPNNPGLPSGFCATVACTNPKAA
jgi:hypothetical protein